MSPSAISPHPDTDRLSKRELEKARAEAEDGLKLLRDLGSEADPLVETWLIQRRRLILAELRRRNGEADPFPLSFPLCLGKAGKQERPLDLPLINSVDLIPKDGEEPVDYLVDGLIPRGSVVLLTAPPGSFKTFFSLCLGRSIGQGEPFLGRALEAGSVTYIDRENPKSVLSNRLKAVIPSPNLTVWPFWAEPEPPLLGDKSYLDLAANRSLLVFDSLRRFHTGSENAPEEMAEVMGYLRELTKPGTTILSLHHSGKAEGNVYRGSTEILAGVDVAFSLEKEKTQTRILGAPVPLTLRCIKHRYVEEPILNLEFVTEGERAFFRDVTAEREGEQADSKREQFEAARDVLGKLERESGAPNQTQVLRALKDCLDMGKNTALKLLSGGEGNYWKSEPKDGSRRYRTLSPFPDTIGERKAESLEEGWEQVA